MGKEWGRGGRREKVFFVGGEWGFLEKNIKYYLEVFFLNNEG